MKLKITIFEDTKSYEQINVYIYLIILTMLTFNIKKSYNIYRQGSKCAVSRIPEEFNIHGGKSTNLLTFPLGKVSK